MQQNYIQMYYVIKYRPLPNFLLVILLVLLASQMIFYDVQHKDSGM